MDSRHESLKEGVLNHVIMTINSYMMDNIDSLVENKSLQQQMIDICQRIYFYLGVDVDTKNIISNHNLLSKDVVLFPNVPDPEGRKILQDAEFENLLLSIKNILVTQEDEILRKQIIRVMEEYEV